MRYWWLLLLLWACKGDTDEEPADDGVVGAWRVDTIWVFDGAIPMTAQDWFEAEWSATLDVRETLSGTFALTIDGDLEELPVTFQVGEDDYLFEGPLMRMRCVVAADLLDCTDDGTTDWANADNDTALQSLSATRASGS